MRRLAPFVAAARQLVEPVLAVVFPARCAACGHPLEEPGRGPLCERCWARLPRHAGRPCDCGFPVPRGGERCGRCRRGLSPLTRGASLGPWEGSLRTAVAELKYRGRRRLAGRLAALLLERPEVRELLRGAALVPVPLHPRRRAERGYNQAELLARALATRSTAPLAPGLLTRRLDTPRQTGLAAAQRRRNVRGAFGVPRPERVAGRVLVLVDDVYTTGATLRACAETLRRAGAAEVRVLTLARVP
jgi:ComF family protein